MKLIKRLKACCKFFITTLIIICAFKINTAAAQGPAAPGHTQQASPEIKAIDLLSKAEIFFHSGKFIDAKILYEKFIKLEAYGENNQLAYYRLGQIEQENGAFQSALWFYRNLTKKFPNNLYAQEISFKIAQCYFETSQYQYAEELFRRILLKHPDKQKRWHSLLYLAKLDQRRVDYESAISKLKQVYAQSDSSAIRDKANELIETIINNHLSVGMLSSLMDAYQSTYPGSAILLKLISNYRLQRSIPEYKSSLERFLILFPNHPMRPSIENQLRTSSDNASSKIKLAAILPLSGKLALTGQKALQGIQLAMNRLPSNLRGNIQLLVKDSKSGTPMKEIIKELGSDPDVVAVIGPILSPHVRQAASEADKYNLPLFSPTASGEGIPELSRFIFRNSLTRNNQANFIAEYSVNKLGLRRFIVLYPNKDYGIRLKDSFHSEVQALGAEVITEIPYERSQNDFKDQILQMGGISDDKLERIAKAQILNGEEAEDFSETGVYSRPLYEMGLWTSESEIEDLKVDLELGYDAIFIPGFYDKVGLIVPQLVFYNIDNATLLGAAGWNSPKLIKSAGKYLKKSYFVDGFFPESQNPKVKEFTDKFKKLFGQTPAILSAQSYDAAQILLGLLNDNARTRKQIRQRLLKVKNYPGVSGLTSITDHGDSEKKLFTLTIKSRKFVEVN